MSFEAAGEEFEPINTAIQANGSWASGDYYSIPTAGLPEAPAVYPIEYEDRYFNFPGVDWTAVKRFGARARKITATLMIINTPSAAVARAVALGDTFTALARYTVSYHSNNFNGCRMAPGGMGTWATFNVGAKLCIALPVMWVQLSDSN